jgi:hypothetical protein
VLKQFNDWRDDCIQWFNDWVSSPYQYKRKQLYLYGPASTGKSTFIQRVLFAQYGGQVFKANSSDEKYCWENFNQKTHNLVTLDEFDYKDHNINTLKLVLAGEDFICPVKYQDAQVKFVQCPVVIMSNNPPPVFNRAFMERIQVIDTEPVEGQVHGPYVNFLEFLDLWLYQKQLYNYETDATEAMKHSTSLFTSEEYIAKVTQSASSESSITIVKRKAQEAFADETQVSEFEPPASKKRTFVFKKTSQQIIPPSINPITSTPISSVLDSNEDDDDFIRAKKSNVFSLQEKIKRKCLEEEIKELVEETIDYILN